jgi:hypothetical protein
MPRVGHKGVRDGGPARRRDFRPEDVVGLPVRQALVDLAHEGFDAEVATPGDDQRKAALWLSNRVRLVVRDGVVQEVVVG